MSEMQDTNNNNYGVARHRGYSDVPYIITELVNVSNSTAWCDSRPKANAAPIEPCRNTGAAIVLIVYNTTYNSHNAFRNTMVKNSYIMKAYGNGEFVGMANERNVVSFKGNFGPNRGLGVLQFDTIKDAEKFLHSDNEIWNWLWMGAGKVEVYVLPCINPMQDFSTMPYFSLDLHDVKDCKKFRDELTQTTDCIQQNNGYLVTATKEMERIRGRRLPGFFIVVQFETLEALKQYDQAAEELAKNTSYTRVIAEMIPFVFPARQCPNECPNCTNCGCTTLPDSQVKSTMSRSRSTARS